MLITLLAERVSFEGNNQTSTTPNESTVNNAKYVPSTDTVPSTTTNDKGPNINTAKRTTIEKSTNPPVDLSTASGKFKTSHTTSIHIQTATTSSTNGINKPTDVLLKFPTTFTSQKGLIWTNNGVKKTTTFTSNNDVDVDTSPIKTTTITSDNDVVIETDSSKTELTVTFENVSIIITEGSVKPTAIISSSTDIDEPMESCSSYCDSCGTWNNNTCAYDCAAGFYGANCTSQCSTLCKNGAEVNETDCGCLCNEKQYGSLCDCRYPYTGGNCDVCKVGTCENCGTFNPATCRCDCLAGYGGLQCELSCADKANSTFCAAAVAAGDCVNNNIFMEEYCMLSCGLCTAQCPAADCSQPSRTGMTSNWCQCDKFTCVNNFGCIETTQVNDGVIDCPDGSDEPVGVVSSGSQGQASSKNVDAGVIAAIVVVVAVFAFAATGAILYFKFFRKTPVKSLKKRPSAIFPSKTTGNGAPPVKKAFKMNGVPKQAF